MQLVTLLQTSWLPQLLRKKRKSSVQTYILLSLVLCLSSCLAKSDDCCCCLFIKDYYLAACTTELTVYGLRPGLSIETRIAVENSWPKFSQPMLLPLILTLPYLNSATLLLTFS